MADHAIAGDRYDYTSRTRHVVDPKTKMNEIFEGTTKTPMTKIFFTQRCMVRQANNYGIF